ncbi:MAG TPA: hypothetical protein VID19_11515 [Candidatus Eremiobacteraceae bacterium]
MILALMTALAVSGGASSSTSSAPAPAATAPLREVVYKVSYTRQANVSNETFGGGSPANSMLTNSASQAFAERSTDATDTGTVTIDVMQVAADALGIRVTEHWNGATPAGTYQGNVAPDGTVNFRDSQMNECTALILEYFGAAFMTDQPAQGVRWERTAKGTAADLDTVYTVGTIDGAIAKIHEQTTVKSKSVALLDSVTTADVQYKPAMLAPLSGRIVTHGSRSSASSVTNISTVSNFDRISDTRDQGP